jgi:hypothetical protein
MLVKQMRSPDGKVVPRPRLACHLTFLQHFRIEECHNVASFMSQPIMLQLYVIYLTPILIPLLNSATQRRCNPQPGTSRGGREFLPFIQPLSLDGWSVQMHA